MDIKKITILCLLIIFSYTSLALSKQTEDQQIKSIKEEQQKLLQWQKELQQKEERLKKIELDIIEKEAKIDEMKKEILSIYKNIKAIQNANVAELATIYSKMKPNEASQVISQMDVDLAVKIFLKMKPNKIAKILNLLNREKAVKITEKLALFGVKINPGGQK